MEIEDSIGRVMASVDDEAACLAVDRQREESSTPIAPSEESQSLRQGWLQPPFLT